MLLYSFRSPLNNSPFMAATDARVIHIIPLIATAAIVTDKVLISRASADVFIVGHTATTAGRAPLNSPAIIGPRCSTITILRIVDLS